MLLRGFAVLAAIAVPLVLTIDAVTRVLPDLPWLGPALAAAFALPIVFAARFARGQAAIGAGVAAMAAAASAEVPELLAITGDEQALVIHDLREGPLPATREGYVAVRGFLRSDWQVDEYRVAAGERPDQNQAAKAVLVPLLGTNAERIEVEADEMGRVLVARVTPTQVEAGPLVTLRGRLGPVAPDIVDSLFAIQIDAKGRASETMVRPEAVMLDTFDMPTRSQAITRAGLAIGASVLALLLLLLALPRVGKPVN